MVSEANEPGSDSGKRSDDRRGVPGGTQRRINQTARSRSFRRGRRRCRR